MVEESPPPLVTPHSPETPYIGNPPVINGWRIVWVMLLIAFMLVPLWLVSKALSHHFGQRQPALQHTIGQALVGPVLVVPYVEHYTKVDTLTEPNGESRVVSKDIFNDRTAILLPEKLEIRANIKPEPPHTAWESPPAYVANLSLQGAFNHAPLLQSSENERRILWDKAYIVIGLRDPRGIDTASSFFWNEGRIGLQPSTRLGKLLPHGFHVPIMLSADSNPLNEFKLTLTVRGHVAFSFAPLGENTAIRISSPWLYPQFGGEVPPDKQTLNEQGFLAEWDIPHLVRNYPQFWVLEEEAQPYAMDSFNVIVGLSGPQAAAYPQVQKAVAYGLAFVGLAFLLLLNFEAHQQRRLHTLHYLMVGGMLAAFYLVVAAILPYMGLAYAYWIAALLASLGIAGYLQLTLRNPWLAIWMAVLLLALYLAQYLLLPTTSYGFLAGVAVLLLAALLLLPVTRHLQAD